jgi:zinc transporter ZupT
MSVGEHLGKALRVSEFLWATILTREDILRKVHHRGSRCFHWLHEKEKSARKSFQPLRNKKTVNCDWVKTVPGYHSLLPAAITLMFVVSIVIHNFPENVRSDHCVSASMRHSVYTVISLKQ